MRSFSWATGLPVWLWKSRPTFRSPMKARECLPQFCDRGSGGIRDRDLVPEARLLVVVQQRGETGARPPSEAAQLRAQAVRAIVSCRRRIRRPMRMPTPSASCDPSKGNVSIGSYRSVSATFDEPSPSSWLAIITNGIIKGWTTPLSMTGTGRPGGGFAVGLGSVGSSITTNGPVMAPSSSGTLQVPSR